MKKAILILTIIISAVVNAQVGFGRTEGFAASLYIDPGASQKENGLDIGADIEYQGAIYAKIGVESFEALPGGYFDIHGAVGPRITIGQQERLSLYAGLRGGVVLRNGATNAIGGFEGGIDYVFPSGLFLGLNGSYIYRGDMKAMQWPEIWRENFYVRIGYKWNWRK